MGIIYKRLVNGAGRSISFLFEWHCFGYVGHQIAFFLGGKFGPSMRVFFHENLNKTEGGK
jgi:hypothetical protein